VHPSQHTPACCMQTSSAELHSCVLAAETPYRNYYHGKGKGRGKGRGHGGDD
jgi:hypothetical protein